MLRDVAILTQIYSVVNLNTQLDNVEQYALLYVNEILLFSLITPAFIRHLYTVSTVYTNE